MLHAFDKNDRQARARMVGGRLTAAIERYPETLHSISGDTEVEFSFARNLDSEGRPRSGGQVLLAYYSPFMVAEFRDWLRQSRYAGDRSPASDDDHDGHTSNGDFRQQFRTWQLRCFNESGPISFAPFAWTNDEQHKQYRNQDTAYERALRKFVQEIRR